MAEFPTEAQLIALAAMPFQVTMWGGKPFTGYPKGVRSQTLTALLKRGYAKVDIVGNTHVWQRTEAGQKLRTSFTISLGREK